MFVYINREKEKICAMSNYQVTDAELIDGYLNGNVQCFEELLMRYKNKIFNYVYRQVDSRELAEDIFQETFSRVIDRLDKFSQRDRFGVWLFRIARNLCIDHLRRKKKMVIFSLHQPIGNTRAPVALEQVIAAKVNSPVEQMQQHEMQKILKQAITSLPQKQKDVLLLHVYAGLTFREISRILKCSINTALARMQYALANLRKYLKNSGVGHEL